MNVTYEEYLAWAKVRALAILKTGDVTGAYASLSSDFTNDERFENHAAITLGMMLLMAGRLQTSKAMQDFIEGCH